MAGVEPQLSWKENAGIFTTACLHAWGNGFAVEAAKEAVTVASSLQPKWPVVAHERSELRGRAHCRKMLAYDDAQNWTPVVSRSLRVVGSPWFRIPITDLYTFAFRESLS